MTDAVASAGASRAIPIRTYLLVAMLGGMFLQQVLATTPFEIRLGYFLIIFNCFILLSSRMLIVHPAQLKFLLTIFTVSVIAAFWAGYSYLAVIPQVLGIGILSVYYFTLISVLEIPVARLLELYARVAVYVALISIGMNVYQMLSTGSLIRLQGIFSEPALFVHSTLPALSFYAWEFFRYRRGLGRMLIMLLSYVLADSAIGFLGIILTVYLLFPRKSPLLIMAAGLLCLGIFAATFYASPGFRQRVEDALTTTIVRETVQDPGVGDSDQKSLDTTSNASVMALFSNAYVAYQAFMSNPLIGTGLGTHRYSYDRYAGEVLTNEVATKLQLNRDDANSLFLRMTSELGLFGWACIAFFFLYFGRVRGESGIMVRNCLIPFFAIYLLRLGHYFQLEFEFFVIVFIFNFMESRWGLPPWRGDGRGLSHVKGSHRGGKTLDG
jgi:hypothetical protein